MTNIYDVPNSQLIEDNGVSPERNSIEHAVTGNYEFSIRKIMQEAWAKSRGGNIQLGAGLLLGVIFLVAIALCSKLIIGALFPIYLKAFAPPHLGVQQLVVVGLISRCIQMFFGSPIIAGVFMLGVKRATGAPVKILAIFDYAPKTLKLFGTSLLMALLVLLGFCLLILPGIYLLVAYSLALPLVADKNLSPWQALEVSRKTISHHWFGFAGLYFLMAVVVLISAIPAGIGLLWTLPMSLICLGVIYRNAFGYTATH